MSVTNIPESVKYRLWGKAAGRCEYDGCNEPLWLDSLTKAEFNIAYIAHIIADKPGGPRGNESLSRKLAADISNLMLLCDCHHRLIDKDDILGHSVERLREMKQKHEDRMELVTAIQSSKRSEVILYGERIGKHHVQLSYDHASHAMIPYRYPARTRAIELSLKNYAFEDADQSYWVNQREHLHRQFAMHVGPILASGQADHFSVFAIGPQPLLIELGRLLSDIPPADVYQLHREPPDWRWQEHQPEFQYQISEPAAIGDSIASNRPRP